jgi:hypothetical protein
METERSGCAERQNLPWIDRNWWNDIRNLGGGDFLGLMKWYGKVHRNFELIHANFQDDKFRELIVMEAT